MCPDDLADQAEQQVLTPVHRLLLEEGYHPLLEAYRRRSVVMDRNVTICSEDSDELPMVQATGTVRSLGDGLELFLEGRSEPVRRGRLILEPTPEPLPLREMAPVADVSTPASPL